MTQVEICNLALGWLAASTITSIEDASVEAQLCKASWTPTRDVLLQSRPWTFATQRFQLPPDAKAPAFGWARRFAIPTTVLTVLRCVDAYGENVQWEREGAFLLSDEETLNMVAIVRVESTSDFPPAFGHAFAARLASDLAIPITQNAQLQVTYWKLFEAKLREAATVDGKQGRTVVLRGPTVAR